MPINEITILQSYLLIFLYLAHYLYYHSSSKFSFPFLKYLAHPITKDRVVTTVLKVRVSCFQHPKKQSSSIHGCHFLTGEYFHCNEFIHDGMDQEGGAITSIVIIEEIYWISEC